MTLTVSDSSCRALKTLLAMNWLTLPKAARVAAPSMMSAEVSCWQIFLALDWGLGGVGCDRETGSWHSILATSGLKQLRGEYKTRMKILTRMFSAFSSTRCHGWLANTILGMSYKAHNLSCSPMTPFRIPSIKILTFRLVEGGQDAKPPVVDQRVMFTLICRRVKVTIKWWTY